MKAISRDKLVSLPSAKGKHHHGLLFLSIGRGGREPGGEQIQGLNFQGSTSHTHSPRCSNSAYRPQALQKKPTWVHSRFAQESGSLFVNLVWPCPETGAVSAGWVDLVQGCPWWMLACSSTSYFIYWLIDWMIEIEFSVVLDPVPELIGDQAGLKFTNICVSLFPEWWN